MNNTKKWVIPEEGMYLVANLILSLSVAMAAAADFGVSMIVAPAYIVSLKVPFLTFGQSEYVLQGMLFIVFCLLMGKVKWTYFLSFGTCLLYGAMLDIWRVIIPGLNPAVTPPGSMVLWARILLFAGSVLMASLSIALFFRIYIPPQVVDFFNKGVSDHFHIDRTKFKFAYDVSSLLIACVLTLVFFREIRGIWWGTLIITLCNSWLIGLFGKLLDRLMVFRPLFPKLAQQCDPE